MSENGITIRVEGYDASRVEEWLTEHVGKEVREALDQKTLQIVRDEVKRLVDGLTEERLRKDIDTYLEEGWQGTDTYGNPTGKVFTLRDRIRGVFDTRTDSYDRQTRVEKWVKDAVDYQLGKALAEELAAARTRLRAAFDEVLQAKFSTTIREALGLK